MKGKIISQQIMTDDGEIITVYTDAAPVELLTATDQDSLQPPDPADAKEKDKHEEPHTLQTDADLLARQTIEYVQQASDRPPIRRILVAAIISLLILLAIIRGTPPSAIASPITDPNGMDLTGLYDLAGRLFNALFPIVVVITGIGLGICIFAFILRLIRALANLFY